MATEDPLVGENPILSAAFDKDGEEAPGVARGILSLFHGDQNVGDGWIKTQPGKVSAAKGGVILDESDASVGVRIVSPSPNCDDCASVLPTSTAGFRGYRLR